MLGQRSRTASKAESTPVPYTGATGAIPRRQVSRARPLFVGLSIAVVVSVTMAVTVGPVFISPVTVWEIILSHVFGVDAGQWSQGQDNIVWLIRLPRVLLAGLVGAGLAAVGVAMQATVRNPLADPYILGTSSGASVGAVLVIVLGLNFFDPYSLSATAFIGAVGSFILVFLLAQSSGRISPTRLILAGVALAYILSAITSFILFMGDERDFREVLFWMLGTLAGAKWEFLTLPAIALALGVGTLLIHARSMNALLMGDETATALGVDPQKFRRHLLVLAALLTGVMVAVSGAIGFVGLMMPHIVRLVVGSDHRKVLPASVLLGAVFLIWVDVGARTVVQPEELPVSVITALVGAPFFLWLLRWRKNAFGGDRI